jgi:hypothetical protein
VQHERIFLGNSLEQGNVAFDQRRFRDHPNAQAPLPGQYFQQRLGYLGPAFERLVGVSGHA